LICPPKLPGVKVADPGPEADERGPGLLALHTGHSLDRLHYRYIPPVEKHVPGQERAIQLALGDDVVWHVGIMPPFFS
jgi:hypothetical protein